MIFARNSFAIATLHQKRKLLKIQLVDVTVRTAFLGKDKYVKYDKNYERWEEIVVQLFTDIFVETTRLLAQGIDKQGLNRYFAHLVGDFKQRLQTRQQVLIGELGLIEPGATTVNPHDIGYYGVINFYVEEMLKDFHEKSPVYLQVPKGIGYEEYCDFLKWASHCYGLPNSYDEVVKLLHRYYPGRF